MTHRPRIVAFTGSTRRPSKSRTLALAIAAGVERRLDAEVQSFDVVDAGPGLAGGFSRKELGVDAERIIAAIEQADAVIAVTPVYKGSYTGLFKHVIDFVDANALVDKPVVIGATGGGHRHALIVEHQLRPLFGFFSALIVPTSVYASDHEFAEGEIVDQGVLSRIETASTQLSAILKARSGSAAAERLVPLTDTTVTAVDFRQRTAAV